MFRLSSLSYHQVVSLYRENYIMYDMIQYDNLKGNYAIAMQIPTSTNSILENN